MVLAENCPVIHDDEVTMNSSFVIESGHWGYSQGHILRKINIAK